MLCRSAALARCAWAKPHNIRWQRLGLSEFRPIVLPEQLKREFELVVQWQRSNRACDGWLVRQHLLHGRGRARLIDVRSRDHASLPGPRCCPYAAELQEQPARLGHLVQPTHQLQVLRLRRRGTGCSARAVIACGVRRGFATSISYFAAATGYDDRR